MYLGSAGDVSIDAEAHVPGWVKVIAPAEVTVPEEVTMPVEVVPVP